MPPLMTSSRHELFECSLDHSICLMNPYLKIPGRSLVGTSSGGYISPDLPDSASKPRTSSAMSAVKLHWMSFGAWRVESLESD